jgi:cytosine/adenosine deaminase-related metal-dependent hydrolase
VPAEREGEAGSSLPARGEWLFRDAYVVSLDDDLGDLPRADVHVRAGQIVAVGPHLPAEGLEVFDAAGMLLVPGFVDTHWHLWNTLMRGLIGDGPGRGYFEVKRGLAPYYTPRDSYCAARLALAEALDSGITTVHNWDHNVRSPEDADANLQAQVDMGLRGRFSYGPPDNLPGDRLMDLGDLDRVQRDWSGAASDGRIDLGVAVRGPFRTQPAVTRAEWRAARERGLPITMHCDRCLREQGCHQCEIASMEAEGLLGPDLLMVHAVHASPGDVQAMARSGTRLSLSPQTELRTMGFPQVTEMLAAGVRVSLSIDTTAVPTNADMFAQMRVVLSVEMARVPEAALSPRRMLRLATIDGARDLGLADQIGSITPGKRADFFLARMSDWNLVPCSDPVDVLVLAGQPANIDTVVVDGRILERHGSLLGVDAPRLKAEAVSALLGLLDRAGRPVPDHLRAQADHLAI